MYTLTIFPVLLPLLIFHLELKSYDMNICRLLLHPYNNNKFCLQSPIDDCNSKSSISLPSHLVPFTPRFDNEILNFHLRPGPSPFASNQIFEHVVNFNSITTHPFGVFITYDDHFGLPFVKEISVNSPWYVNLPAKFRRNIWILGISSSELITASSAYDALKCHVQDKKEYI